MITQMKGNNGITIGKIDGGVIPWEVYDFPRNKFSSTCVEIYQHFIYFTTAKIYVF